MVSVYDYGVASNGTPYLVMQFLEGGSLEEKLESGGELDTKEAVEIAIEICQGLKYAHNKNLVHRDIKPSNVMITGGGDDYLRQIMLADFDIAKLLKDSDTKTTGLTQTGDLFGTPAYMSPEQCEGTDIDNRSDIYSFGCLLYKMLTGKEPYAGLTPVQVAVKHLSADPDRFAKDCPDGHPLLSLEEIAFKCMRKKPEERYQSAEELLEDLSLVQDGKEVGYTYDERDSKTGILAIVREFSAKVLSFLIISGAAFWYLLILMVHVAPTPEPGTAAAFAVLIGIGLAGTLGSFIQEFKTYKKRKTIGRWCGSLVIMSMFFTYLFSFMACLPKLPHPVSDIGSILLTLSIFGTYAIVIFGSLLYAGLTARKVFYFFRNRIKKVLQPDYKPKKIREVPMRLKTALNQIILVLGVFFIGFIALFPQLSSNAISGASILDSRYNGTFAESLAATALKMDPDDPNKKIILANIREDNGTREGALKLLTSYLNTKPDDADLLDKRAKLYHEIGDHRKAITDLNKSIEIRPLNYENMILKGKSYMALAEYDKAKKDFDTAIKNGRIAGLTHKMGDIYSMRGLVHYQKKNYKMAVADFGRAIEKGDNPMRDYVRRALALNAMGNRSEANRNLQEAIDVRPYKEDPETLLIRAYAAKELGKQSLHDEFMEKLEAKDITNVRSISKIILGELPMVTLK